MNLYESYVPNLILNVNNKIEKLIKSSFLFSGLYRVNYDAENWSLLASTLNSPNYKDINVLNRAQLLVDAMDLAQLGDMSYSLALKVMTYLRNEKEYLPWKAGLDKLESVKTVLSRTANYGIYKVSWLQLYCYFLNY